MCGGIARKGGDTWWNFIRHRFGLGGKPHDMDLMIGKR